MRVWHALAVMGLMSVVADVAAAADGVKLVVVPSQGRGGPNVKSQLSSLVERPLGGSTAIIPFAKYQSAGRVAGVRPRSITGPEAVVPAGRGAGATHVLILESDTDKTAKKKKGGGIIAASLIDVSTGETLLSKKYPFTGKKLPADVANQIVHDVNDSLQHALAPPTPAIEAPPPPPAPANPQPPVANNTPPPAIVAPPPPTPSAPPPPVDNTPVAPPPAEQVAATDAVVVEQNPNARPAAYRPGFRVNFGALIYSRTGKVDAGAGANPPCYCEPAGVSSPVFSRMDLRLDLYPLVLGFGNAAWWEGFGIVVEGSLGFPRTNLGNGNITTSTSGEFAGAVVYRSPAWWDSQVAPDVRVGFGYWLYSFPLNGAVFPGVEFTSPYAGLDFNIPLGIPELALLVGGRYAFHEIAGGDASAFGTQTSSTGAGTGIYIEGGLRATLFGALEITGLFFYENFSASFAGDTAFQNTTLPPFSNVSVTDKLLGGVITAGYAY